MTIEQIAWEIAAEHGDPHDYDHSWRLVRIGIIEGIKMMYKVALKVEQQQDNDHGAANTGGAQQVADTIRALIKEQEV